MKSPFIGYCRGGPSLRMSRIRRARSPVLLSTINTQGLGGNGEWGVLAGPGGVDRGTVFELRQAGH